MTEEEDKEKALYNHLVARCLQAVEAIVETACENCEGINPYLILANVGSNILIQTTVSAHINHGIDAEAQMRQHTKFIKSKVRMLICKKVEEERLKEKQS